MFDWLYDWWYARQRRIDLKILWPACREEAKDLRHAKTAFMLHAYADPAWLHLPKEHVARIVDALK